MLRPRETREEIEMFPIDTIGTCRARSCVRKDKKKRDKERECAAAVLCLSIGNSADVDNDVPR